ncbi:hypothetical protein PILCRDRAFT_812606 [Piloderma croceum F 1598]|uniref:Uncharacterized protein n=1 Tax=Piloderma croceum (strain F 1598) TaxID=765440 RepID=A0A0C3GGR1_PILCF|nr:hypothetical protein PILCRDRAFT_812606 [Piloderma croceum F 1598]
MRKVDIKYRARCFMHPSDVGRYIASLHKTPCFASGQAATARVPKAAHSFYRAYDDSRIGFPKPKGLKRALE